VESESKCPKCGSPLVGEGAASLCPKCAATLILGRTVQYFGDYELLDEIGRGGMGVVYLARQSSLNRPVALKMMIQGGFASPEMVRRFQNEAEAAASLQHPNIVSIFEVGFVDGLHYFSMDYIDGPSLAEVVREGPLPAERAARYVELVAEAIHYAHQRGILHRDLKPSNVLIDPFDLPRVTDFGLAKRMDNDLGPTVTGQILGSPGYMPPEQAAGRHALIGVTSDVYSLGAILYHLLTGRAPFVDNTAARIIERVQMEVPISPRALDPGIPIELEAICLKCLRKEPRQRYGSAAELAADLRHWQRGERIAAQPVGGGGTLRGWCQEHPRVVFAGFMLLLAVAVAGYGGWLLGSGSRKAALKSPAREAAKIESYANWEPGQRWTNSLGMVFVPVAGTGVRFSIWDTRVRDFEAFVQATGYDATRGMFSLRSDGLNQHGDTWKSPGFAQGPTHPVCGVSWNDAKAFCAWLTTKEQREGKLKANQYYRLPMDAEWSLAAGLSEPSAGAPKDKSGKVAGVYPWGTEWPPPSGTGNYAGEEINNVGTSANWNVISGYYDNFARTSPVGRFNDNRFGLYDMGGNVWQWCEDFHDGQSGPHVMRGAAWDDSSPRSLLSSNRAPVGGGNRRDNHGFRCVLAPVWAPASSAQ
jgi:formylglycine-generating enzyme required for sulfatase activity/predicted Ser/Thr protein kinase